MNIGNKITLKTRIAIQSIVPKSNSVMIQTVQVQKKKKKISRNIAVYAKAALKMFRCSSKSSDLI